MANTYKNIVITPNRDTDAANVPVIRFSGGDATTNTDINVRVYTSQSGTLSFEGSAGQLFSITNDLTNSIFSVNDVSGIPSIDVYANGNILLAPFGGQVFVGNTANVNFDSTASTKIVEPAIAANTLTIHTAQTERIRFDSSGNVLINRTNSTVGQNVRLDVAGAINASAVLVNGTALTGGGGETANVGFAFNQANAGLIQANTARDHANTAHASANAGLGQANTARIHANVAFEQANTARIHANVAFEQANTARIHANASFEQANTARIHANASFEQANTARIHANASFEQANTARIHANTAHASANAGLATANASYAFGNSAHSIANLAFTHANNAYSTANNATTLGKAIAMVIVFG